MAVPQKYRELGDFHEYYSGARVAPYLTIFVGGNHEASNHLFELYYGGWAAPNIYYIGAANVLQLGGLRIAGLSGIWKGYNYRKPHFERVPYNQDDVRSAYHVRELDMRKLMQVSSQVDVGLSHDWPQGIEWLGDHKWLFRKKDSFEADAVKGELGSIAARLLLERLKPPNWFSAHLHIRYEAVVDHTKDSLQDRRPRKAPFHTQQSVPAKRAMPAAVEQEPANVHNDEEIDLDMDDEPKPANVHNDEEIDFDLDNGPDSTIAASGLPNPQTPFNGDEINLDDDLDDANDIMMNTITTDTASAPASAPATVPEQSMPDNTTTQDDTNPDNAVPEDILAQLPASFRQPQSSSNTRTNMPSAPDPPHTITNTTTHFLALDKCLPRRNFLELLEITPSQPQSEPLIRPLKLEYDPEYLAITRAFAHFPDYLTLSNPTAQIPPDLGRAHYAPLIFSARKWVLEHIVGAGKLEIPENFVHTAPVQDPEPGEVSKMMRQMPREHANPQTAEFCELLGIPNVLDVGEEELVRRSQQAPRPAEPRFNGRGGGGRGGFGGHVGRGRGGSGGRGFGGRGWGRGRGEALGNANKVPLGRGAWRGRG